MLHRADLDAHRIAAYGAAGSIAVVNAVVVLSLIWHVAAGARARAQDPPPAATIEAPAADPHPRDAEATPAGPARR